MFAFSILAMGDTNSLHYPANVLDLPPSGIERSEEKTDPQAALRALKEKAIHTTDPEEKLELGFQIVSRRPEEWVYAEPIFEAIKIANEKKDDSSAIRLGQRYISETGGKGVRNDILVELSKAYEESGGREVAIATLMPLASYDGRFFYGRDIEDRINRIYFDLVTKEGGSLSSTPPWVHLLSPSQSSFSLEADTPLVYRSPRSGIPTEAYFLLQAEPGSLFSKVDLWADVNIREEPRGGAAYFVYLSDYHPYRRSVESPFLIYSKSGRQELAASATFKEPCAFLTVRLFSSEKTREVYGWRITADFAPGNAVDNRAGKDEETASTRKGRVQVDGTPPGTAVKISSYYSKRGSFVTSLPAGHYEAIFSNPELGRIQVGFPVEADRVSQVGASLENGWSNYSVSSLPSDIGPAALARLPGGSYLVVASQKEKGFRQLRQWISEDLVHWHGGKFVDANLSESNNCSPTLLATRKGRVLLFWFLNGQTLFCCTTQDAMNWSPPRIVTEFQAPFSAQAGPSVLQTPGGDYLLATDDAWTKGNPGKWQDWKPYRIENNPSGKVETPDLLLTESSQYVLAYTGTFSNAENRPRGGVPSVFVASSTDGIHWQEPVQVGDGTLPHLYESGGNLWVIFNGKGFLESHYTRDGKKWFGPSHLTPLFEGFQQSDIVDLGDGRFAAVDTPKEGQRHPYPVSLHVGRDFPDRIARLEDEYRWEDCDGTPHGSGMNAYHLQNATDFIWSINPYGGFGRFDKRSGEYLETREIQSSRQPGLERQKIGALAVDGDRVWIGANAAGLYCLDQAEGNILFEAKAGQGLRSDVIPALAVEPGLVWVGTPEGLQAFDPGSASWLAFDQVTGLQGLPLPIVALALGEECLWIAGRDGRVLRFDKAEAVTSPIDRQQANPESKIIKLLADGPFLWIVCYNGIWRYNEAEKVTDWIFRERLNDACIDRDFLWVATDNSLLRIPKATGQAQPISINSTSYRRGINFRVHSIATDDKYVYLGIYGGLTRGEKAKLRVE
jgi:hypothetical protein